MTRLELIRSLVKRQVGPTHLRSIEPKVAPVPIVPTIHPLPKVKRANIIVDKPARGVIIVAS